MLVPLLAMTFNVTFTTFYVVFRLLDAHVCPFRNMNHYPPHLHLSEGEKGVI